MSSFHRGLLRSAPGAPPFDAGDTGTPDPDPLAPMPDRRLARHYLKLAIDHARRHGDFGAFLTLDLDNFRQFNHSHDDGVGDRILADVASRLTYLINEFGIVVRLDGDKFGLLLAALDTNRPGAIGRAKEIANCLRDAISRRLKIGGRKYRVSCSIGVHVFGAECDTPHSVIACSELAMYGAKSAGKNQVNLYDISAQRQVEDRAGITHDLSDAIEDSELALKYQPQTDSDGRIIGAEALVRWDHPERGEIAPDVFIPIAEECGLIIPLTNWVLEQSLDTLVRWQRHPRLRDLSLSVNISAQQFHQEELLSKLEYFARHYPIDMSRLVLELTERVFVGDMSMVKRVMSGLQRLDIRFSLDDYGTGYSSLSQLRHLAFDELKIDGTFIREIGRNSNDQAIVRSTLAMAKALSLKCVAEWVETDEQREFLREEGCDYLQGHLFGAAMTLDEFEHSVFEQREE